MYPGARCGASLPANFRRRGAGLYPITACEKRTVTVTVPNSGLLTVAGRCTAARKVST